MDFQKPGALGMRLINILVEDLNGKIEYSRSNNTTKFDLVLKIKQYS
jgi:two-component sensor histidine kinase